jgi:hypothetical protein
LRAAFSKSKEGCEGGEVLAVETAPKIGGCEPRGLLCLGFVFAGVLKVGAVFGVKVGGMADFVVEMGGIFCGGL